ncbi:MAG: hypothetical protein PHI67_05860 [Candidatus Methanomethylophilaceae archaeon]|nr:hypothetical protein [Candidatus Methanomethylophilaceae archaeon]
MHKGKRKTREKTRWVAYHIEAAKGAQIRIYADLVAQRRSKILPASMNPEKLLEMTPEEFFATIPKRMYPDLENFMNYMICMNAHLVKAARFLPDTPQVRREIERAKRDTISLAREYWIPKNESQQSIGDCVFKTGNKY